MGGAQEATGAIPWILPATSYARVGPWSRTLGRQGPEVTRPPTWPRLGISWQDSPVKNGRTIDDRQMTHIAAVPVQTPLPTPYPHQGRTAPVGGWTPPATPTDHRNSRSSRPRIQILPHAEHRDQGPNQGQTNQQWTDQARNPQNRQQLWVPGPTPIEPPNGTTQQFKTCTQKRGAPTKGPAGLHPGPIPQTAKASQHTSGSDRIYKLASQ